MLEKFCNITFETLTNAPRKTKHTRGNQMPFMMKDLSKNILKRLRIRNKYLEKIIVKIMNIILSEDIT